jgi:hypothetical protein
VELIVEVAISPVIEEVSVLEQVPDLSDRKNFASAVAADRLATVLAHKDTYQQPNSFVLEDCM